MTDMTETVETSKTRTQLVDEFLTKHGAGLPTHIVDFALDLRAAIAELEDMVNERMPAGI